jgi:dipeptidyl-peptidase-4
MKRILSIFLLILFVVPVYSGELKKLTLQQVILRKGEQLYKRLPSVSGWADDSNYFQYQKGQLMKVNVKTGKSTAVMTESKKSKIPVSRLIMRYRQAEHTADFRKFLVLKDGAVSLFLPRENTLTPLLKSDKDLDIVQNPTFSPDGSKFAYTMKGNLYVYDIAARKSTQLTTDGSGDILNGYASWVYYEEILGRRSRYRAFWWSPDSSRIAFMRFDQSMVQKFYLFKSAGDYGKLETMRYPKAGYPNPLVKIGIADITTKQVRFLDFQDKNDHYLVFPTWNETASKLFFQWMNRGQDHVKILSFDLKTGAIQPVYEEKQKAWVNFFENGDMILLKNDDLLVRSARDGWYHIYYVPATGEMRPITSGQWSVTSIDGINEKKKVIYFSAHKEDSTETDFYRTGYRGKKIQRLTRFKGTHRVSLSPGCSYFIDTYSDLTTPERMELRDTRGRLLRKLGDSSAPVFKEYEVSAVKAELFRVKITDGYALPVIWYLPPDFDRSKKYPVVMTIYGGPERASVSNSFGSGYRSGLGKLYLAQEGIINVFVDHRGSGHFGKKGMDEMHRQLGKWEIHDYKEVALYLTTLPFIDAKRIGISGHSYGGYVAAYALTYGGDFFKYGISASPVTDWRLYDTVYTERFMDTPQENPEGYKTSAAARHVDKYDSFMRLTHGTMDDNVHPQNTMQLLEAILDAGKTVELMLYPSNRHGVRDKKIFEYYKSNINFWMKHFFGKTVD